MKGVSFRRILGHGPQRLRARLDALCRSYSDWYRGENDHDPESNGELRLARLLCPGASCLLDVGANVGDWTASALRVEWRSNIDDILDEVMRLYRATLAHASLAFEELTPEFFRALVQNAGLTVHLDLVRGDNPHHIVEAAFKAFARALDDATTLDPRVSGVPSTKGVL